MTTESNVLEMTADSVGRDLLQALVTELKLLPKPWVALTKAKQDDVIDRLRARVEYQINMAVHVLASDGRTTIAADLEQVTAKDGIKAQFKISQASQGRHDLFDSVGRACLIVLANAEDHTGGMNEIQGEHDQRAMDLGVSTPTTTGTACLMATWLMLKSVRSLRLNSSHCRPIWIKHIWMAVMLPRRAGRRLIAL